MNRIKTLLMLCLAFLLACCSAPALGEDAGETDNVGQVQEALSTCAISGFTGSSTFGVTVITEVRLAQNVGNNKLVVTACPVSGGSCTSSTHTFDNIAWSQAANGDEWGGSVGFPLRRMVMRAPGCMLSSPDKWCMDLYGDLDFGDHVNLLQNGERFLFNRPVTLGAIEAPVGGAIVQFYGTGHEPDNNWRAKYTNAAGTGLSTKYWAFTTPGCQ